MNNLQHALKALGDNWVWSNFAYIELEVIFKVSVELNISHFPFQKIVKKSTFLLSYLKGFLINR
jgi:hypothetical protein